MRVVSGMALFLVGIWLMARGGAGLAGKSFQLGLQRVDRSRVLAAAAGAAFTAAIQSSSASIALIIGLVEGGSLSLEGALAAVLGANVGTTATAQLASLQLGGWAPLMGVTGLALWAAGRGNVPSLGCMLLGLGLLFGGMGMVEEGLTGYASSPEVLRALSTVAGRPAGAFLLGAFSTGLVQSSSLVAGLSLWLLRLRLIDFAGAVYLVLGSNVGTCATALLVSIGVRSAAAKRAAWANLLVNLLGVSMIIPVMPLFLGLARASSPEEGRQLANSHTLFNLVTSMALLPFTGHLARLLKVIVAGWEPVHWRGGHRG